MKSLVVFCHHDGILRSKEEYVIYIGVRWGLSPQTVVLCFIYKSQITGATGSGSSFIKIKYSLKREVMLTCAQVPAENLHACYVFMIFIIFTDSLYMSLGALLKLRALAMLKHKGDVFSTWTKCIGTGEKIFMYALVMTLLIQR